MGGASRQEEIQLLEQKLLSLRTREARPSHKRRECGLSMESLGPIN